MTRRPRVRTVALASVLALTLTPLAAQAVSSPTATHKAVKTMPHTYRTDLVPCESEDGPAPCAWDARTAGNGIGHSFWLDAAACIHYLAPKDAKRWDDHGHGPCTDPYESSKPARVRECQDQAAEGDPGRMAARFAACWIWPTR